MISLRTPALLALVLSLTLGGCSGSVSIGDDPKPNSINSEKLVNDIRADYEAQTDIDLPRLKCGETASKVGATIDCAGRNARDVELQIDGEVTALEGDEIKYRWNVSKATAPGKIYAAQLAQAVSQKFKIKVETVQCPPRVELKKGDTLTCEVKAERGIIAIAKLEQTNADGGFKVLSIKGGTTGSASPSGSAS